MSQFASDCVGAAWDRHVADVHFVSGPGSFSKVARRALAVSRNYSLHESEVEDRRGDFGRRQFTVDRLR